MKKNGVNQQTNFLENYEFWTWIFPPLVLFFCITENIESN